MTLEKILSGEGYKMKMPECQNAESCDGYKNENARMTSPIKTSQLEIGAATLSISTLRLMTISIVTISIMTISIITLT